MDIISYLLRKYIIRQRRTQLCAALLLSAIYLRILSHDFSKIFADKYGRFL